MNLQIKNPAKAASALAGFYVIEDLLGFERKKLSLMIYVQVAEGTRISSSSKSIIHIERSISKKTRMTCAYA
ncbi:hypothetical protein D3C74_258570 [compost metagenome]